MSDAPVSVVTGANSGIGRATAIYLAQQGHTVYGTVRATSRMDTFHKMAEAAGVEFELVELDVAEDDSVARGFAEILDKAGRVDVLVNNAGVGGNAVAEEATPELYLDVMNVNLCGAIRCLKHVCPGCASAAAGRSSTSRRSPARSRRSPSRPTSRRSTRSRVSATASPRSSPRSGSVSSIIEPGVTKSAIFAKSVDAPNATGAYDAPYRRMFQFYARGSPRPPTRSEVAQVIHHAITTDEPKLRYAMSWGGQGMIDGREAMSDADWVELGAIEADDEYYARFHEHFGVDIAPRDRSTRVFEVTGAPAGASPPATLGWPDEGPAERPVELAVAVAEGVGRPRLRRQGRRQQRLGAQEAHDLGGQRDRRRQRLRSAVGEVGEHGVDPPARGRPPWTRSTAAATAGRPATSGPRRRAARGRSPARRRRRDRRGSPAATTCRAAARPSAGWPCGCGTPAARRRRGGWR